MFFELVSILFAIVPDYGNEYMTKENNNWTSFKNFAPKLNLNHNSYTIIQCTLITLNTIINCRIIMYICLLYTSPSPRDA